MVPVGRVAGRSKGCESADPLAALGFSLLAGARSRRFWVSCARALAVSRSKSAAALDSEATARLCVPARGRDQEMS
jgi:hypothetical protein